MKQLAKALVERTMQAGLAGRLGYEKHDQGKKPIENRRNGKTAKELRTGQGPMTVAPRGRKGGLNRR
jgi:transposase-like protein